MISVFETGAVRTGDGLLNKHRISSWVGWIARLGGCRCQLVHVSLGFVIDDRRPDSTVSISLATHAWQRTSPGCQRHSSRGLLSLAPQFVPDRVASREPRPVPPLPER